MKLENRKIAGLCLFIGGIQCVLGIIIAEALYPGYSTSENYISDLGVGPSSLIFNSSVFVLGVLGISAAYFIHREGISKVFVIIFAAASIGAMGVGLFTEHAGYLHTVFSLITFLFGSISAIISYKVERQPLSHLYVALGIISLAALVLFASNNYLGLGKGGMERIIAYPTLLWTIAMGASLAGNLSDASLASS
jgi:hypothetical membrane protein